MPTSRRTRKLRVVLLTVVGGVLLGACGGHKLLARVSVDPSAGSRSILFTNVNVFDGATALGARDVRVRDGKIEAIGEPGTLPQADGDEEIDGQGKTLMPGLIDAHIHLESSGEAIWDLGLPDLNDIAQAYLYAGVTTGVVMQASTDQFEFNEMAKEGQVVSPRLYLAGPRLTAPDGFPINLIRALLPWPISSFAARPIRTAANATEAREVVEELHKKFSPTFFKITSDAFPPGTPKLSPEALVAAIVRSNELGMRPTAHIGAPEDVLIAAEAGLALFAHPATGARFTDAQVARLAALKIPFCTTQRFLTGSNDVGKDHGTKLDHEIVAAEVLEKFSNRPKDFQYPAVPPGLDADKLLGEYEQNIKENALALYKAGVPLFVGTDSGSPGVFPGAAIHRELRALVAAGIPTLDVLKMATSAPADFLDKDHSYGRIAAGQRADLLLVTGDPVTDIAATEAIVDVFQAGRRMSRTSAAVKP